MNELHAPLRFIQKELINPTLAKKNEKSTGFRTCAIVGEVPVPPAGSYQPPEPDELTDLKAESFDDQGPVPAAEGAIIDEPDAKPTKRERVKAGK